MKPPRILLSAETIDAGKLGYAATFVNSLGVLAMFAVVTGALYGLNRLKPAR